MCSWELHCRLTSAESTMEFLCHIRPRCIAMASLCWNLSDPWLYHLEAIIALFHRLGRAQGQYFGGAYSAGCLHNWPFSVKFGCDPRHWSSFSKSMSCIMFYFDICWSILHSSILISKHESKLLHVRCVNVNISKAGTKRLGHSLVSECQLWSSPRAANRAVAWGLNNDGGYGWEETGERHGQKWCLTYPNILGSSTSCQQQPFAAYRPPHLLSRPSMWHYHTLSTIGCSPRFSEFNIVHVGWRAMAISKHSDIIWDLWSAFPSVLDHVQRRQAGSGLDNGHIMDTDAPSICAAASIIVYPYLSDLISADLG